MSETVIHAINKSEAAKHCQEEHGGSYNPLCWICQILRRQMYDSKHAA